MLLPPCELGRCASARRVTLLALLTVSCLVVLPSTSPDGSDRPGPGFTAGVSELAWVEDSHSYSLNGQYISDLKWSPDHTLIAAATASKELGIIDPDVWPKYRSVNLTGGYILSVDWSPDGECLAASSVNGSVVILDTQDWTIQHTIEFPSRMDVMPVAYSPDGRWLFVGRDDTVSVLNTTSWSADRRGTYEDARDIHHMACSPDGSMLIVTHGRGCLILDAEYLDVIQDTGSSQSLDGCWSPESDYYAATARTGICNIVRAPRFLVVMTLYGHHPEGEVNDASWSGDGSLLTTCRSNGWITVWETETWNEVHTIHPRVEDVTQVAWGEDVSVIASGDAEANVILYRLDPKCFVELSAGSRLYANYTAYDFNVNANPIPNATMPSVVRMTLDPDGANVTLECGLIPGGGYIGEASDPEDLVDLQSGLWDVIWDGANNTGHIHFKVMFNWTWPHEDPCDVRLEMVREGDASQQVTAEEFFSVENDLELVGTLSAEGEWQGQLSEGDWVRGGENVTLSGPVLVYQGTDDLYPRPPLEAVLAEDDGTRAVAPVVRGRPLELTLPMQSSTDVDELLTLGLAQLPDTAELVNRPTFRLSVDGDAPVLFDAVPDPEEWHCTSEVMVAISARDVNTSGVDASTLELRWSTGGTDAFGPWTRGPLAVDERGATVEGFARLTLPDGDDNYVMWRVRDMVGNVARTAALRVRVDTVNVTFTDPVPSDQAWICRLLVLCGVTVTDLEGSGIDVSTIQFRVSPRNLSQYGEWVDWDEGSQGDATVVRPRTEVEFALSTHNYVQWRAMDIAGNGFTVSPHYRVRVDVQPITFGHFTPEEGRFVGPSPVTCGVTVADNPGGSLVDLASIEYRCGGQWTSAGMEGSSPEMRFTIVVEMADGRDNRVQFRGLDVAGNGPASSPEYTVWVDSTPPAFDLSPGSEDKQEGPWVEVSVTIVDELSGVNASSVICRCRPEGGAFGQWTAVEVTLADGEAVGTVPLDLRPGRGNLVQFRASDMVGNAGESGDHAVWVNGPPTARISSPSEEGSYDDSGPLLLSANGSEDPDGDRLEYTWYVSGNSSAVGRGSEIHRLLGPGEVEITLVVVDDMGAEGSASVRITVEHVEPPGVTGEEDGFPWVLLIVVIALLLSAVAIVRWRVVAGRR